MCENRRQIADVEHVREYILGGKGTITMVSKKTGNRYTFTFGKPKGKDFPVFVRYLYGPDNTSNYRYMGAIFEKKTEGDHPFVPKKSMREHNVVTYFQWMWTHLHTTDSKIMNHIEIWHEGRCCRCGRKLTVPESIERGIGPVCENL